jgi:hypothetical protein
MIFLFFDETSAPLFLSFKKNLAQYNVAFVANPDSSGLFRIRNVIKLLKVNLTFVIIRSENYECFERFL